MKDLDNNKKLRIIIVILVLFLLIMSISFISYLSIELGKLKRAINDISVESTSIQEKDNSKVQLNSIVPIYSGYVDFDEKIVPYVEPQEQAPVIDPPAKQKEHVNPTRILDKSKYEVKLDDEGRTLLRYGTDTLWVMKEDSWTLE